MFLMDEFSVLLSFHSPSDEVLTMKVPGLKTVLKWLKRVRWNQPDVCVIQFSVRANGIITSMDYDIEQLWSRFQSTSALNFNFFCIAFLYHVTWLIYLIYGVFADELICILLVSLYLYLVMCCIPSVMPIRLSFGLSIFISQLANKIRNRVFPI